MRLRAYECNIKGRRWYQIIHHETAGKAKHEYWRGVREAWPDIPYTAVRCRVAGPPTTSDNFRNTALYRGVPLAHVGMAVEVGGYRGAITGVNSSSNWDVLFEYGPWNGQKLNCHPNHEMVYFDQGKALYDFRKEVIHR